MRRQNRKHTTRCAFCFAVLDRIKSVISYFNRRTAVNWFIVPRVRWTMKGCYEQRSGQSFGAAPRHNKTLGTASRGCHRFEYLILAKYNSICYTDYAKQNFILQLTGYSVFIFIKTYALFLHTLTSVRIVEILFGDS